MNILNAMSGYSILGALKDIFGQTNQNTRLLLHCTELKTKPCSYADQHIYK